MSGPTNQRNIPELKDRASGLWAWLGGRPAGGLRTGRGRWVKMILTAGLLVAGLSAWAIAVVQPWAARTTDPGIVAVASANVTPQQMRLLSEDVERLCAGWRERRAPALHRNPFASRGVAAAEAEALPTDPPPPAEEVQAQKALPAGAPAEFLSAVKGLRVELTLTGPGGEPWAVINGQDCHVGDMVAGLEIVEIGEGWVTLKQGTVTCRLRMH